MIRGALNHLLGLLLAHHPVQHGQLGDGVADQHHAVGGEAVVKVVQAVQEYQGFSHLNGGIIYTPAIAPYIMGNISFVISIKMIS